MDIDGVRIVIGYYDHFIGWKLAVLISYVIG